MADLPELGEMIPKVEGVFIEYGGHEYFRCKSSLIPDHDLIRIGFRLYTVGEYVAMIDAWRVTPFLATITERDWELLTDDGD